MVEEAESGTENEKSEQVAPIDKKLSAVSWGLLFLWAGMTLLSDQLHSGVGLLGLGIIILGLQVARLYYKLPLEGVWVIVGIAFTLGGVSRLFHLDIPIVAIALVLGGLLALKTVYSRWMN